jgi:hypothetical protein
MGCHNIATSALTSGPGMSEIVSIRSQTVICANCKKLPLGW